ncbi:hypothetical protein [Nocardia abscessus]|uniref:hypothetical protein n=1 Tax=Nocardia abscessus TaxID=120957 RepID=UPI0024574E81|nr:hypothetical protein [Nocardia abscessus]
MTAFENDYYWALSRWEDAEDHIEGPFPYTAAEVRVLRDITGRRYDELRSATKPARVLSCQSLRVSPVDRLSRRSG